MLLGLLRNTLAACDATVGSVAAAVVVAISLGVLATEDPRVLGLLGGKRLALAFGTCWGAAASAARLVGLVGVALVSTAGAQ